MAYSNIPAGGSVSGPGPTMDEAGVSVPRAVYYDGSGYQSHRDRDDTATATPIRDADGDDGLPDVPRYEGPDVADAAPLVNPSAGNQGPTEAGMDDINPQGPAPTPGDVGPTNTMQAPDNVTQHGTTGYGRG